MKIRTDNWCHHFSRTLMEHSCGLSHRNHIKLEGAWGPKIGVKLKSAILSKLQGDLFFSRPFSVCSRTLRSNSWSSGNFFVFVSYTEYQKNAFLGISQLLLLYNNFLAEGAFTEPHHLAHVLNFLFDSTIIIKNDFKSIELKIIALNRRFRSSTTGKHTTHVSTI